MSWPDLVIAVSNVVFIVSLLPTVWHQWRVKQSTVPLSTSLLTVGGLLAVMAAFYELGLWAALGTDVLTTVLWATVAIQRLVYGAPTASEHPCCGAPHGMCHRENE